MNLTSKARIEANRRNAAKSTGPRTTEGKARSSRNATSHGLFNFVLFMDREEKISSQFKILLADLREEHQPVGPTEDILVFKIAQAFFTSQRANALLTEQLERNDRIDNSKQVALMMRYFTSADRAFNRNLQDLRKLQKERQLEDLGFVSQNDPEEPVTGPFRPPAEPVNPVETAEIEVDLSQSAAPSGLPPLKKAA